MELFKKLKLKTKYFWGSLFYLSYAPKAFRYSRWKEKVEQEIVLSKRSETFEGPGKLINSQINESSARFYFEHAQLEISFLTSDLVRMDW